MKTVENSLAVCLMSISLMDMFQLLWFSKEFDDIADLLKEFIKPTIVLSMALHFIMNTLVIKKPFHYILSTVVFGLIGIGYFCGIFFLAASSDKVISNIITETRKRMWDNNSIFSLPILPGEVEKARKHILSYCLVMYSMIFSLTIPCLILMLEKKASPRSDSQNIL